MFESVDTVNGAPYLCLASATILQQQHRNLSLTDEQVEKTLFKHSLHTVQFIHVLLTRSDS